MIKLVKTCYCSPEQYDAFFDGIKIGYLRLRHGHFRAEYKNVIVYEADTVGDGIFEFNERDEHLTKACLAILSKHLNEQTLTQLYTIEDCLEIGE